MTDVKIRPIKIMLDKERNFVMDLNALEELEEIYGDLDTAMSAFTKDNKKIKHVKNFLYAGLVHEDSSITQDFIGKNLGYYGLATLVEIIYNAVTTALPDASTNEEQTPGE